jgi:hypothetical protein
MSELRRSAILAGVGIGGVLAIVLVNGIAGDRAADARLSIVGYAIVLGAATLFVRRRQRARRGSDSTLMDPNAIFRIVGPRPERRNHLLLSLAAGIGCALIVIGGGIFGHDVTLALLGGIVLGVTIPAFLLAGPRTLALVLSPAGFDYSDFGVGPVAWKDVRSIRHPIVPSAWLVLGLENEASYWSRAPQAVRAVADRTRAICGSGFAICPKDLGVGSTLLSTAIDVRLHRFGDPARLVIDDDFDDRDETDGAEDRADETLSPPDRHTSSSQVL